MYLISTAPVKDPVQLYWRQSPTYSGPIINLDLPSVPFFDLHYNQAIETNDLLVVNKTLQAFPGKEGKIVLTYSGSQNNGPLLGVEIINVLSHRTLCGKRSLCWARSIAGK